MLAESQLAANERGLPRLANETCTPGHVCSVRVRAGLEVWPVNLSFPLIGRPNARCCVLVVGISKVQQTLEDDRGFNCVLLADISGRERAWLWLALGVSACGVECKGSRML